MTDSDDPFGGVWRLFEQFDTTGSTGVPPALGFPLSPFPMPGAGDFSAEASTKRTVRQLYSTLAGFSDGQDDTMLDAWQQYLDTLDVETSLSGSRDQAQSAVATTYRLWFYSLAQHLVESYTLRIVHDELVVEGHEHTTGTQQWLWGLSQPAREQLLRRCSPVEDDLLDEMETARTRRDELLYTFTDWTTAEFEGSLDDARQYLRVLTALDERVTDDGGFSYFPGDLSDEDESGDEPST